METQEDIVIAYRTLTERERAGALASVIGWIARHPLLAGLAGGLGAVGIAFASAYEGVFHEPQIAAILSGLVVVVWMVLFWLMRDFFARQLTATVEVVRGLVYGEGVLRWTEEEEIRREIHDPIFVLLAESVPSRLLDDPERHDEPRRAWLVARGDDPDGEPTRLVIATRLRAIEAVDYPAPEPALRDDVDDRLPTHVLSPLLILARNRRAAARGDDDVSDGEEASEDVEAASGEA